MKLIYCILCLFAVSTSSTSMFIDTPTQGTFHATLDGKPLVLVDNNRFTGMVTRSSVDPVTNQPAENVMSTFHCADKRDILLTIGYDGKTGEKKIANAMMNIPNKTYSSNGSFDRANVTSITDDADGRHFLYSATFEMHVS